VDFEAAVIMVIGTDGAACSCQTWIKSISEVAKITGRQVDLYLLRDIDRVLERYKIKKQ
jgi:hypothetical protein